jgi:hypothetical protein
MRSGRRPAERRQPGLVTRRKRIVVNSSYEGQAAVEIYTVRPDGRGPKRVRKEPKDIFSFEPVWSPSCSNCGNNTGCG